METQGIARALPRECPSCGEPLIVKRLVCTDCGTSIEGAYDLPALASLASADQEFILAFVKASGSLKEMARLLRVSYPTVRNRLDEVIDRIEAVEKGRQNGRGE
jgi:hypothetical protein